MNTDPRNGQLADLFKIYFELAAIVSDFDLVSDDGILEYAIDSNILVLCQHPTQSSHGETVRLISGPEGTHLAHLYASYLASLLVNGPASDITNVKKGYCIFPAHHKEFDRLHIDALHHVGSVVSESLDKFQNNAVVDTIRQIVTGMLEKHANGESVAQEYEELRHAFPEIVAIISGDVLRPAEAGARLESLAHRLPATDVDEIQDTIGSLVAPFLKSSDQKKLGAVRADTDTVVRLIAENIRSAVERQRRRLVFLTLDLDLLALRHAFRASGIKYKGWPLADMCCIRDARLVPFMPGFEWAAPEMDAYEKLRDMFVHMAPLAERFREDISEVDLLMASIRRLWIANRTRPEVLQKCFHLSHPPARNAISAMFLTSGEGDPWRPIVSARQELATALELLCLAGKTHSQGADICRRIDVLCHEGVRPMFQELAFGTLDEAVKLVRRARWLGPDALLETAKKVFKRSKSTGQAHSGRMPLLLLSMTSGYFANLMKLASGREFSMTAVFDVEGLDKTEVMLAIAYLMALDGQWANVRRYSEETLVQLRRAETEEGSEVFIEASMMAAVGIRLSGSKSADPLQYIHDMGVARRYISNAHRKLAQRPTIPPKARLERLGLAEELAANAIFVLNHIHFFYKCEEGTEALGDFMSCREALDMLIVLFDELQAAISADVWHEEDLEKAHELLRNVCLNICSAAWIEAIILKEDHPGHYRRAQMSLQYLEDHPRCSARQSYAYRAIIALTSSWLSGTREAYIKTISVLTEIKTSDRQLLLHYEEKKYDECIRKLIRFADSGSTIQERSPKLLLQD